MKQLTEDQKFDIILSKNRIARELKSKYLLAGHSLNEVDEFVKYDFDVIERQTGTMNQPTGRDILQTYMDI